ncbi:MAG: hypothetical protein ACREYF_07065 [Gammaproteobacteria bacterium]
MIRVTLAKFVVIAVLCLVCSVRANGLQEERTIVPRRSFAVYALSRGHGVPEAAREVLRKVRAWLDQAKQAGSVVDIRQTRIGVEGETRMCAEFADSESAQAMLKRVRALAEGIELMNLVVEPCDGG